MKNALLAALAVVAFCIAVVGLGAICRLLAALFNLGWRILP
jgi:hypothetical protein